MSCGKDHGADYRHKLDLFARALTDSHFRLLLQTSPVPASGGQASAAEIQRLLLLVKDVDMQIRTLAGYTNP